MKVREVRGKRLKKAKPKRLVVTWGDRASEGTALPLPRRRFWGGALVTGALSVPFVWIVWDRIESIRREQIETVFDLTSTLFLVFWTVGFSVGALLLVGLTLLFLLYTESARIVGRRLVFVPRLGPIAFRMEYALDEITGVRVEVVREKHAQVAFDYPSGPVYLGNAMPAEEAARVVSAIENAIRTVSGVDEAPAPRGFDVLAWMARRTSSRKVLSVPEALEPEAETPLGRFSAIGLLVANLVPLFGVLFLDWDLGLVMVLFWTESGVIALYNVVKLAVAKRWAALFAAPFFLAHFGAFMSVHFMFVYALFVQGPDNQAEAPVGQALGDLYGQLWPAVVALFVSHGISFVENFIGRKEYVRMQMKSLMTIPYERVVLMHLTIIFGGGLALVLGTPLPALVLLILLKTAVDFRAHRREHGRAYMR